MAEAEKFPTVLSLSVLEQYALGYYQDPTPNCQEPRDRPTSLPGHRAAAKGKGHDQAGMTHL